MQNSWFIFIILIWYYFTISLSPIQYLQCSHPNTFASVNSTSATQLTSATFLTIYNSTTTNNPHLHLASHSHTHIYTDSPHPTDPQSRRTISLRAGLPFLPDGSRRNQFQARLWVSARPAPQTGRPRAPDQNFRSPSRRPDRPADRKNTPPQPPASPIPASRHVFQARLVYNALLRSSTRENAEAWMVILMREFE